MQQSKTASAAGLTASARAGDASTGSPSFGQDAPNARRGRKAAPSEESQTVSDGAAHKSADAAASAASSKPKKGKSAAASTLAPASQKTVAKPNRPQGKALSRAAKAMPQEDAIALLQRDHRTVEQLFSQYEKAQATTAKEELARQICLELIIHAHLEEEIFYPACREEGVEDDALDEAQVEHDGAKVMIGELLDGSPDDPYYDSKVKVLKEYIRHHVNEEEKADGIFSKARQAGLALDELGAEMKSLKDQLTAEGDAVADAPLETPSLQLNNINTPSEEMQMPRSSRYEDDEDDYRSSQSRGGRGRSNADRDDQGRFMSDDEDGRSSRSRSSHSSYEDEDDDRGGRSGGGRGRSNMERDDQGRFMSDDDDDNGRGGRSRSSRSSYDDDDRSGGRGGNRGRSSMDRDDQGRFMSDDDDDNNRGGRSRASRSNDDDDNRSSGGRGRSSRSRSDQDDDDRGGRGRSGGGRGHGGWFGDSEGHSRAASQRQQAQSSGDDDDDDNRGGRARQGQGGRSQGARAQGGRSSGGRHEGHGGWFGDSEGHARAARRGWRDRD